MPETSDQPQSRSHKRPKKAALKDSNSMVMPGASPQVNDPWQSPKARLGPKKGRLACFMNLPLDVWSEVFGYLDPHDLLKLSRTTTDFREMLMSRSVRLIWVKTLSNVPHLPPCPEDMTEPQYTHLVFSPHCHFCQARTNRAVDWDLRTRMCASCFAKEVETVKRRTQGDDPILQLIPTQLSFQHQQAVLKYLKHQYKTVKEHLDSLDLAHASEYILERQKMMGAHKEHTRLCSLWAQFVSRGRSEELEGLKAERLNAVTSKLIELGWSADLDSRPIADALAGHNLVKKPQKLTERIWGNIKQPLLEFLEPLRKRRLERERQRIVNGRKLAVIQLFRKYKNSHLLDSHGPIVWPEPADYLDFEPVRGLVEMSGNECLTSEMLSELEPRLDRLIWDWYHKVEKEFVAHVRSCIENNHKACRGPTCSHQPLLTKDNVQLSLFLQSPTAIFRCQVCTEDDRRRYDREDDYGFGLDEENDSFLPAPSFFARDRNETETKIIFDEYSVLQHQCLTRSSPSPGLKFLGSLMDLEGPLYGDNIIRSKLSFENITLDESYGCVMANIVKVAGQDPEDARTWDLDNRHFYCHTCFLNAFQRSPEKLNIGYFKHQEMAMHIMEVHNGKAQPKQVSRRFFRKLGDCGSGKTIKLGVSTKPADLKIYSCVHCRDLPSEVVPNFRDLIMTHIAMVHRVETPTFGRDFYKVADENCHYPAPFRNNLFTKKFLVVNDRKALGDGPDIDWERLLLEQFDEDEKETDQDERYSESDGSLNFDREPEPEYFESDTDNERY